MYGNPGFLNYLQGLGYEGEAGPDMRAYAQGLRAQGQHPRMDYMRSMQPQGLGALGQPFAGMSYQRQPGIAPHPFAPMNPTPPRPMFQPMGQGMQAAPQLGGLSA